MGKGSPRGAKLQFGEISSGVLLHNSVSIENDNMFIVYFEKATRNDFECSHANK
jgi:hypothetical protein